MLHEAAQRVVAEHGGEFPRDVEAIAQLPGIGRSTAAAIAAFAFGTRGAILDGNVKRVLARHRGIEGFPGAPRVEAQLWRASEALLPVRDVEAYTQGMMDLGAKVCVRRNPVCGACPVAQDCRAHLEDRVHALPTPRPARVVPHRCVQMLLIEHAGEVLLEKRAPVGVWAGMWCLPEVAAEDDARAACAARFGGRIARAESLGSIEHAFTHYRLTIKPVRIVLQARGPQAEAPGRTWLARADALQAALPAPVRKLLRVDLGSLLALT
jgi:A/G-specific adenine glycosylase